MSRFCGMIYLPKYSVQYIFYRLILNVDLMTPMVRPKTIQFTFLAVAGKCQSLWFFRLFFLPLLYICTKSSSLAFLLPSTTHLHTEFCSSILSFLYYIYKKIIVFLYFFSLYYRSTQRVLFQYFFFLLLQICIKKYLLVFLLALLQICIKISVLIFLHPFTSDLHTEFCSSILFPLQQICVKEICSSISSFFYYKSPKIILFYYFFIPLLQICIENGWPNSKFLKEYSSRKIWCKCGHFFPPALLVHFKKSHY